MNPYRVRVWSILRDVLTGRGPFGTALDFGAGDGWFGRQMLDSGAVADLTSVDVQARPNTYVPIRLYDGNRLPLPDKGFNLVYAVDVFHHCPDPPAALADALRCAARYFLLKDHTYRTAVGRLTLCALDELGNRRFGVPSRYKYQRRWDWLPVIEAAGFRQVGLFHPARCHARALGAATNSLQFVGLWERAEAA
jgi:SAM-dependent methyltransferase